MSIVTIAAIAPAAFACDLCLRSGLPAGLQSPIHAGQELLRPLDSPSVPALSSRPQANAKLFLDFDGDVTPQWVQYAPGITPAYDIDGDRATFSPAERTNIQRIWAGIAEKYSPFNIDVTTIDPGPLVKGQSFRLVIGGRGEWYSPTPVAGGIAYIGSFYNHQPTSTAYIFSELLLPADPLHTSFVTAAGAHEAGHGFGLQHQSVWSASGALLDPYNRGDEFKAPLMGSSYRKRGIWWEGTSLGPTTIQNDLLILSSPLNGFGYRADDHGDTPVAATPLDVTGNSVLGAGVIEHTGDIDYFAFETLSGDISLTLSVAPFDAMLDGVLSLYNLEGVLLQRADTTALGETLSLWVAEGAYRLAVSSHGGFGDIGQYTIGGTIHPVPEPVSALTLLGAALFIRRRAAK